jgi:type IV pilus assembly protein PilW
MSGHKSWSTPIKAAGFTLLELLIAMAMGVAVMSGVVSVLVVSKSNYITERELAALQENARFALKFLTEEIQMAGYNGCSDESLNIANSVNFSSDDAWYLGGVGLVGYEEFDNETDRAGFPDDYENAASYYSDSIAIRRGEQSGLRIAPGPPYHNPNSANIPLNDAHDLKPGQIMVISSADCQQTGVFQLTGPTNTNDNATTAVHNTGRGGNPSPGNCTKNLGGNFSCASGTGGSLGSTYPPGSSLMRMRSMGFYIGTSSVGSGIPALFRTYLDLDEANETAIVNSEELVQGVEIMQISYGVDLVGDDGLADQYMDADNGSMDWDAVVSVRLNLRMRSVFPVYNETVAYDEFMGIDDTDGSDRFMRQLVGTTIQIRNR